MEINPEVKNDLPEVIAEVAVAGVNKPSEAKPIYIQFLLPGAILLAAIIVSGTLLYTRGVIGGIAQIGGSGANQQDKVEIKLNPNDHVLGNQKAKVTIVEFSDFQCPFCRNFWKETLPEIKKNFIDTGKVKFVYKHFPLSFHSGAKPAAEGAECANEQGKFWEMHDKIFQEQSKKGEGTIEFTTQDVAKWAATIGLDVQQFNQCVSSDKYLKLIDDDTAYGITLGVSGTPTTFVNGKRIVGAQPYDSFRTIIEGLLK